MEVVRRRANRLLNGPDYEGLTAEEKAQTKLQIITAWLPQALKDAKEEREQAKTSRKPKKEGLGMEDLRRAFEEAHPRKSELTLNEIADGLPNKVQRELS